MVLMTSAALAACTSPEQTRARGGGPGADVGNRPGVVKMHEGSQPYWETPELVAGEHSPLEPSQHAQRLSRQ